MKTLRLVLRVAGFRMVLVDLAVLTLLFLFSIALLSVASCIGRAPHLVVAVDESSTVMHGGGSLPYTGVVSASVLSSVVDLLGTARVCPEVVALVSIEGRVVYLRGVEPRCLTGTAFHTLEGESMLDAVLVGRRISKVLGVYINDTLLVRSLHTSRSAIVRVAGIVSGNEVLESEIVADIQLARQLRGFTNQVSIVRFVNASREEIEMLKNATPNLRSGSLVPSIILSLLRRIGVNPQERRWATVLGYTEAIETTRVTSLVSIATTLILSAGALTTLPTASLGVASNFLKMLAVLGLGEKRTWRATVCLKILVFTSSFLLSLAISVVLWRSGLFTISFLHHYWVLRLPVLDTAIYFSASTLLYIYGLIRTRRMVLWEEEPVEQLVL